jgi:hypothetical protein
MADSASDADFLVLVVRLVQTDATVCQSKVQLDLNPLAWHHTPLALHDALDHILVFLNAHLALRDENQLAVYACSITSSRLLYSSLTPAADAGPDRDANTYAPFRRLDHRIAEGVKDVVRDLDETLDHGQFGLRRCLEVLKECGRANGPCQCFVEGFGSLVLVRFELLSFIVALRQTSTSNAS